MRLAQELEEEGEAFNELLEAEELALLAEHEAVGSNAMAQFGAQMRDLAQFPLSIIAASVKENFLCYGSHPAHTAWKAMDMWYAGLSGSDGIVAQDLPFNDLDVYTGAEGDGSGGVLRMG
jgi:hypothetical protein